MVRAVDTMYGMLVNDEAKENERVTAENTSTDDEN